MRLDLLIKVIFLTLVASSVRAADRIESDIRDPQGLLEVDSIRLNPMPDMPKFNQGREYLISINRHLPDARTARTKLALALREQKQLDQFVFIWFGSQSPKRLDLLIGHNIPVPAAQAAIRAYATEVRLPVYIALTSEDDFFGQSYSISVGALKAVASVPIAAERIRELLKPGLTHEDLAKLLTKRGD